MLRKKKIISNKILKIIYQHDYTKRTIISLYKYFKIHNPIILLDFIKIELKKYDVLGRIYIATEGINVQISTPDIYMKNVIYFFKNLNIHLKNICINYSIVNRSMAFWKLQIKIRKQLVANNIHDIPILTDSFKNYLNAFQVNKCFFDKNTIFVDIRNHYEYEIGHFHRSLEIPSNTFREQLDKLPIFLRLYQNKKIVLYCTGGIRCEKAAALLKKYKFKNIYQIYGGILSYINQTKTYNLPMYFKGKLFVFDSRMAERITNDVVSICKNCQNITDSMHINCLNNVCHRLFIQCEKCSRKLKSYCSKRCLNFS
ncbi:rhodanese-related sulfurtransferase [Buchnera aphidicola]|uniref:oxygen-dependent tRNA uridine(34) hydroxylase TrhO n=1 Tax=Buchnera aphidicola TaxID=9 RepID=UPI00094D8513|nr:rhodanese-related sulfurtransferase [Buchnera aphidicola]